MIKLGKVFDRFPQLTRDQRNELARRRAVRAFELIPDKETQMKNPLLVLRISGTIKQILTALNAIGLNKTVGELIKERK